MTENNKQDIAYIVKWAFGCGSIAVWIGLLISSMVNFEKILGLPTFVIDLLTMTLSFLVGAVIYLLCYWIYRRQRKTNGKNVLDPLLLEEQMKSQDKPDIVVIFKYAFGSGFVGIGVGLFLAAIGRFHIRFGLPVFITDLITIVLSFIIGAGLYIVFYWLSTIKKRS